MSSHPCVLGHSAFIENKQMFAIALQGLDISCLVPLCWVFRQRGSLEENRNVKMWPNMTSSFLRHIHQLVSHLAHSVNTSFSWAAQSELRWPCICLAVLVPGASVLFSGIFKSNWTGIMECRARFLSTGWPPDYSSHTLKVNEMLSKQFILRAALNAAPVYCYMQ